MQGEKSQTWNDSIVKSQMFVFETKWGCSNGRERTKPKRNGTRHFFTDFTHTQTQECGAGGQAIQLLKLLSWLSTRRHCCCGIGRWLISCECVCGIFAGTAVTPMQWPYPFHGSSNHFLPLFFHAIRTSHIACEFCYCFRSRDIWLGAFKVTTARHKN